MLLQKIATYAQSGFESWTEASRASSEAKNASLFVLLPGLEPRIADPKSAVISISPQEHWLVISIEQKT
jgi:hypothetical protein